MKGKVLDLYYFTGTGNTLLVVKMMVEVFSGNGVDVHLFKIEESDPGKIDLSHAIGLAFPVVCQSTFLFVWDFMRSLPDCHGTEIFMVDTLDSFSGAIVGPLKRVLKKKGYRTIGAKEIIMPGNWFPKRIKEEKNRRRVGKGLPKAEDYARAIVEGRTRWRRVPILSDAFHWICSRPATWKMMAEAGKKYNVDKEKCNGCGFCEKLCPVDNVTVDEFPRFGDHCQQCMRCIAFCPKNAIFVPDKEYRIYKAVKVKELLSDKAETRE